MLGGVHRSFVDHWGFRLDGDRLLGRVGYRPGLDCAGKNHFPRRSGAISVSRRELRRYRSDGVQKTGILRAEHHLGSGGQTVYERDRADARRPTIAGRGLGIVPSWASWTWPGYEGKPLTVQVYSRYDRVRLYLNDELIDEMPTTREEKFKALFHVPYTPGTLKTMGVQDGKDAASSN